jgi:hypothetical protein
METGHNVNEVFAETVRQVRRYETKKAGQQTIQMETQTRRIKVFNTTVSKTDDSSCCFLVMEHLAKPHCYLQLINLY